MSQNIEKIMAMLGGVSSAEYTRSCLTDQDRTQINNAIEVLFSGISLRNWLGGDTLGVAWTRALDTVRDFVFSFSDVNPAVTHARQATFDHRRKWQTKIVMSPDADERIQCSDAQRPGLAADADAKIQNGVAILRAKISDFSVPNSPRTNACTTHQMANARMVYERTHEHEREHERTE
ncbi:MAG: hypothetical protein J6K82_00275 [Alphaproteobacteria bacterium]|nr:hypothetical protein [Alphaproteobacteria bacterium]